ncbi:hypothetical protein KDX23_17730 [Burkholderia vietnamiensis]|uniref:hypothetical protein n=1 Tax=Burkholderia vietnamiensis TaxID=60552 RepID=UPI001BA435CF|nr:hypothetical protein [Burkholderia vietnamiensis]MBR8084579.1 hypothetical protein [Burkholderia vietnamiensis]
MPWTNPIDKLQIPHDWASHVVYGGVIGAGLMAAHVAPVHAIAAVIAVGAAKKVVDFFTEGETTWMCVGKTIVGAVWPASIWLVELAQSSFR